MPADTAAPDSPAAATRRLMRTALKASLATLDRASGHPYASLVLVAAEPGGAPIFLISKLALHTRNLEQDPRASLLLDGTAALGDPLAGARATLVGTVTPSVSASAKRRFLARHPAAAVYADFPDFATYTMQLDRAHFIGGFGRIVDLQAPALLTLLAGAQSLVEAEPEIIAHMNADHADAVSLFATRFGGQPNGNWQMCGIDPDGADLMLHRTNAVRIDFPAPVHTPGEARAALVALTSAARTRPS